MIDLETETPIHFPKVGKLFPGIRKPTLQTLHRWRLTGVLAANGERVKLETCKIAGLRYCSAEAVKRFLTTQNATETPAPQFTPSQRQRMASAANRALEAAGL